MAREAIRHRGFQLLQKGMPKVRIAEALGVSYMTVHRWAVHLREEGSHSWREKARPGRPRRLTPVQRKQLQEILVAGALARGYPTDLWTLKRVAEVIRKEFGVRYTLPGVWRVLRGLGLSAQVPRTRALERNEEYIRQWLAETWPQILRQAMDTNSTLVFIDESGIQTTPNVRRSWAPKGVRPTIRCRASRKKLSIISGVTLEGQLYFEVHRDDLSGTEVIWFLEQLLEEIRGRILVVWDNIGIHRSAEVATFLWMHQGRLTVRRIPPYAPELNPDEGIWDVIKNDQLGNYCPQSFDELEATVQRELRALKANPERVMRALQQTELPIHSVEEFIGAVGFGVTSSG